VAECIEKVVEELRKRWGRVIVAAPSVDSRKWVCDTPQTTGDKVRLNNGYGARLVILF
jgi:hypothetical protein